MTPIAETPVPAVPQPSGVQYAVRILIGCVIGVVVLNRINHPNPLWALISVIIVTEPELSAPRFWRSKLPHRQHSHRLRHRPFFSLPARPFALVYSYSASSSRLSSAPISSACREAGALPSHCRHSHDSERPGAGGRSTGLATAIDRTEEVLLWGKRL